MQRIGIAASKIAKGNLLVYNLFVVLISFLFSLFIFFLSGSAIVIALIVMAYVFSGIIPIDFEKNWISIMFLCMMTLTIVVSIFNLLAIFRNIKLYRSR